ncbi:MULTISPECIES: tRNA uridine-5-carboxymethylaminomethyl(34) synthesis enzyme MnmG [unclassified Lebetimonas]|uniref:tRNA uridine-5-carboxymethylaminomethyl(34) synthesis enzyme MnmG n=1 Tax=unclassified Lebetimonas TaxID=2648158 RepID=UPI00046306F7|nr:MULTISPECIES: tRNA uridine-5-carboxymethylaminomethyl(34) synthesis enzyme MnmG [unclassified Lebetimonas]
MKQFDCIVVGGGHAGIEAAAAAAKMGKRTLLLSMLVEQIGAPSCNPAIGGLAKGHLVKEIDALGGLMPLATDNAGIQFRILNENRGPAVRGSRAQIDMDRYRIWMRTALLNTPNLEIAQEIVDEIIVKNGKVAGVKTNLLNVYKTKTLILTTGTFMRGIMHFGPVKLEGGRFHELPAKKISKSLENLGFKLERLKTGTTARIDARSIDFSKMELQEGDKNPKPFSFRTDKKTFNPEQLPCYITYTNETTHDIIKSNFYRAPLFTGQIEGIGPRYCPSIEDKLNKFPDKERHHVFIEPQTREATEYYLNGLSTSLPMDVQDAFIHSILGLENAKIVRYGYAIEYDFIQPTNLKHSLETKEIEGLFFAGQINGTTGYEEAAAQGIMAGINAVLKVEGKEPIIFRRDEAYIGVLIDDLVTKGTNEPYRMFTSRSEYRLLLREDNAMLRLADYGYKLGLLNEKTYEKVLKLREEIKKGLKILNETFVTPNKGINTKLEELGEEKIQNKMEIRKIVARHTFTKEKLLKMFPEFSSLSDDALEQILIQARYHHYIQRQKAQIDKMKEMLKVKIPEDFEYRGIPGLSREIVEKLEKHRPVTLFQASEISGVTPAAIDIIHMYINMRKRK